MSRQRAPEADVDGTPRLVVRDEDREFLVIAVAELLILAIQSDEKTTAAA